MIFGNGSKWDDQDANEPVLDESEEYSTADVGEAQQLVGETAQRTLAERQGSTGMLTDSELDAGEPVEGALRKPMGPGADDGVNVDDDEDRGDDIDDVDGDPRVLRRGLPPGVLDQSLRHNSKRSNRAWGRHPAFRTSVVWRVALVWL